MRKVCNMKFLGITPVLFLTCLFAAFLSCPGVSWSEDTGDAEIRKELEQLKSKIRELDSLKARVQELEEKLSAEGEVSAPPTVKEELAEGEKAEQKTEKKRLIKITSPYLGNISIGGGLSGGYFVGNNEGVEGEKDNFVLTNLLIDKERDVRR